MIRAAEQVRGRRTDILQIVRFGVIGVCATLVHSLLFVSIVHWGAAALIANGCAFLCASIVSYVGHSRWTFAGSTRSAGSMTKFGTTTIVGFVINSVFAFTVVTLLHASPWIAAALMAAVTPVIVFGLMKYWVFR